MKTVLISPMAGVLSAYGIGRAEHRSLAHRTIERPLTKVDDVLAASFAEMERDLATTAGDAEGRARRFERRVALKLAGADTTITVPAEALGGLAEAFHSAYAQRFAFTRRDAAIVVESAEVELIERTTARAPAPAPEAAARSGGAEDRRGAIFMNGAWREACIVDRETLPAGAVFSGPAMMHEATGANVVEAGWSAEVLPDTRDLVLRRVAPMVHARIADAAVDPVRLELFANLFMAIAEQMGVALQSTAYSVNIKERLDFSCAVFDASGGLVANEAAVHDDGSARGEVERRQHDVADAAVGTARADERPVDVDLLGMVEGAGGGDAAVLVGVRLERGPFGARGAGGRAAPPCAARRCGSAPPSRRGAAAARRRARRAPPRPPPSRSREGPAWSSARGGAASRFRTSLRDPALLGLVAVL